MANTRAIYRQIGAREGLVLGFGDSSEDERCGAWCAHTSEMHAVSAARLSAGTEDLEVRRQVCMAVWWFESYGVRIAQLVASKLGMSERMRLPDYLTSSRTMYTMMTMNLQTRSFAERA